MARLLLIGLLLALVSCAKQHAIAQALPTPPVEPVACPSVDLGAPPDALVVQAVDRASRACWAEAEAAYAAARRLRPTDTRLRDRHARVLVRLKRVEEAEELYRRSDAERPGDADVLAGWGGILLYADRTAEGIQRLRQAIQLNPTHANAHAMLGMGHLILGERAAGIAALSEAERLKSGTAGSFAEFLRFGGEGILPRGPFPSMIVLETMQDSLARGRDGRRAALKEFERIAAELEQPASFYLMWAFVHLLGGYSDKSEFELACARFDKVLELDPDHAWSHAGCARALVESGKLGPAIGRMDRAIDLTPRDGWMHAMYGEILLLGRQPHAAVKRLQDAEQAFPDNPMISVYLWQALQATGDKEGAVAAMRRADEKQRR